MKVRHISVVKTSHPAETLGHLAEIPRQREGDKFHKSTLIHMELLLLFRTDAEEGVVRGRSAARPGVAKIATEAILEKTDAEVSLGKERDLTVSMRGNCYPTTVQLRWPSSAKTKGQVSFLYLYSQEVVGGHTGRALNFIGMSII